MIKYAAISQESQPRSGREALRGYILGGRGGQLLDRDRQGGYGHVERFFLGYGVKGGLQKGVQYG